MKPYQTIRTIANGFLVVGSLGIISLLLFLSFDGYWEAVFEDQFMISSELMASAVLVTLAVALLIRLQSYKKLSIINVKSFSFIAFIALFLVALSSPNLAQLLTNFLVLALGIFTIRDGAVNQRLGILNYGLLIVTALIFCRFFDTDLSFVVRGILFVAVGAGFFVANYWMSKKKNQTAKP
jgi:hypothetical protein